MLRQGLIGPQGIIATTSVGILGRYPVFPPPHDGDVEVGLLKLTNN